MSGHETLLLSGADVRALLDLDRCIEAVEQALLAHALGRSLGPAVLSVHAPEGGFHVKAAGLAAAGRSWFAAKVNGNFPGNPARSGLPTIQGVVALADAADGRLLALLDSMEITALRTAAATAVAARHLARRDASVAAILGCGVQGRVQLRALARVRTLRRAVVFDLSRPRADAFAAELGPALGIDVLVADDAAGAVAQADLCVACTPSRTPIVLRRDVRPGAFVAGVGADSPQKHELDSALLAASTLVVDSLEQAAAFGDLHHAIEGGVLSRDRVHAELHDVVAGRAAGRTREDEIVVFDSTGTALQDVAAAVAVYEAAVREGRGTRFGFAA